MKKGFTLIELLVVVTIVAILAALFIPAFNRRTSDDPTLFMDPSERAFYLEQKRANDIRERELELQYQQNPPQQ